MRREPVAFMVALLLGAACGDEDRRPGGSGILPPAVTSSGAGATTGVGGTTSAGGAGGSGGTTTTTVGTGGATGSEDCNDGVDNDGDGDADCLDVDCAGVCAASCDVPIPLGDPAFVVSGTTVGRPDDIAASCSTVGGSEVVYAVMAAQTGILDVVVSSDSDVSVSLRTDCATNGSELACADLVKNPGPTEEDRQQISQAVTADDVVFVVVEGDGPFVLDRVESRPPPECGDAMTDPGEECDDGMAAGGPCEDDCTLTVTESEPNDTVAGADPWTMFWSGAIAPAGDVDVVSVAVPEGANLVATLIDIGDGACPANLIDSLLTVIGPDGTTVVEDDDFGGAGSCSEVLATNLTAGTYYIRIEADGTATPTFPYGLNVVVTP